MGKMVARKVRAPKKVSKSLIFTYYTISLATTVFIKQTGLFRTGQILSGRIDNPYTPGGASTVLEVKVDSI